MRKHVQIRMMDILFMTGMAMWCMHAPLKSSELEQKKGSYRVRVSIRNLNIRKGSGMNYENIPVSACLPLSQKLMAREQQIGASHEV